MELYTTEDYLDVVLCNSQIRYFMVHKDDNDGTYNYTPTFMSYSTTSHIHTSEYLCSRLELSLLMWVQHNAHALQTIIVHW